MCCGLVCRRSAAAAAVAGSRDPANFLDLGDLGNHVSHDVAETVMSMQQSVIIRSGYRFYGRKLYEPVWAM